MTKNLLAWLSCAVWIGAVSAATTTATMTSTITVTAAPGNTGVTFGGSGTTTGGGTPNIVSYPLTGGDMVQPANTTLTFANTATTGSVTAVVSFGPGANSDGMTRRAAFGGSYVIYYLKNTAGQLLDQAGVAAFGGVAVTVTSGAGGVANVPYTLVVPGGQTVPPGTYTDVVQITATF